ncbi:tRNA lysidine(34) synthetase TilS [Vibrio paucivorans]|uniref:tRNA(Ile)-lysidine synthase n=1 Tax=Vibrio paucivorans TaxID=2829489 RepID=A0A9X3CBV0_9VIBR|nr:tRNA lysidine(34) synthetase TilS [Vibrio paucivorans]MCW8332888.1 tRNA lysidine(34) synthetase TilS [Vibrio paucivorans]
MDDFYPHFANQLNQYSSSIEKVVLALSGGMDSRVLLHMLGRYKREHEVECLAIHVHHGLSDNAGQWAEKCQKWCDDESINLIVENIELDKQQGNIESNARNARYQVLNNYIGANDLLLTGQHLDDQAETFLLALKRGSGPKGLASMSSDIAWNHGRLVRPLLSRSRHEIEQYATLNQLSWVEDESNHDTRFDRNFIRHKVVPVMAARWPSFSLSVARSASLCAEQEQLLNELLSQPFSMALQADSSIDIAALHSHSVLARNRLLRMWFEHNHQLMPSKQHIHQLWQDVALAKGDANPILNLTNVQVRRFQQRLYLVPDFSDVSLWQASISLEQTLSLPDGLGQLSILETKKQGQLSAKALVGREIKVMFNPEGLSAHPCERGHSRKLKKLFQEYGLPSWLRRRTPIVLVDDKVAAVVGLFVDKAFYGQDCELIWDK